MFPQGLNNMTTMQTPTQTQKSVDIEQIKMKYTINNNNNNTTTNNNIFDYTNPFHNNIFNNNQPLPQQQQQQTLPQFNNTMNPFIGNTHLNMNPFLSPAPQTNFTNTYNMNNNTNATRNEIERIKAKYFNNAGSTTTNTNSTKTALLLEEKLTKYKNMLILPQNQRTYQPSEQPINTKNTNVLEINRANNFELNPTNELLISKVSWIEGKLSMSQNKPFVVSSTNDNNNNKHSPYVKQQPYKNENEMSYNYSHSSDNEANDNDNDNDIQPIIDKVDKLKETMREYEEDSHNEDNYDYMQFDKNDNDNNLEAKYIVNNIMSKIPHEQTNEQQQTQNWRYDNTSNKRSNKTNYNYLNELTLNDLQTQHNQHQQQRPSPQAEPKLISKKPFIREGNPMKKKLISFEEFLSLNED